MSKRVVSLSWVGSVYRQDAGIVGILVAFALALYTATLLPGVGKGDVVEFQRAAPTLGLAHSTSYPLYTLLGWLWIHAPLGDTPAWRMNFFSAVAAAGAVGALYTVGRAFGQQRAVAAAAALSFAVSLTFWKQATIAEVYALAALLQAVLILVLLRWRDGRAPFWLIGAIIGLALAHHRTIILLLPGVALFIMLTHWPSLRELGWAALAGLLGCLIYVYVPLRLPPEYSWDQVWRYITGSDMASAWLDVPRLQREGVARLQQLAQLYIVPQMFWLGGVLALLGLLRLRRDWASLALLLSGYTLVLAFSAAYYVFDTEVFLLSAHLIAAILLGEGAMLVLQRLPSRVSKHAGLALLVLPLLLFQRNLPTVQRANSLVEDALLRTIMMHPFPQQSLLIVDWHILEGLRYLQEVEHVAPDVELLPAQGAEAERQRLETVLEQDRPAYLLHARPELHLGQTPEGPLWRVELKTPTPVVTTPVSFQWVNGLTLEGYTLATRSSRPNQTVPVTLVWGTKRPIEQSYTTFIHLVGEDGVIWGQQNRGPGISTDQWTPGQQYPDLLSPILSAQTPPGRYQIVLGWYDLTSLQRVAVADENGLSANTDFIILDTIGVAP